MTTEYFHYKKNAVFVQRGDKDLYILSNMKTSIDPPYKGYSEYLR